jgi:hypothetical protein
MRAILTLAALVVALAGPPAAYAGIGHAIPGNACLPDTKKFKVNLGVLNVNGDGSFGAGMCMNGVNAETIITCTSKEKLGKTIDIAVEYFDSSGATISASPPTSGSNLVCGVGAGETVKFHTVPPGSGMPGPWGVGGTPGYVPTSAAPVPIAACSFGTTGCFLNGSARILSTSTKVQCTATKIDINIPCNGAPGIGATKNLTIIKKAAQQGD